MSTIQGAGRLGKDPVLKHVGEDSKPVCELSVNFLNYRKNKQDETQPIDTGFWVQVSVWGKFAEPASQFFKKGDRIFIVDGDLDQDSFIPQESESKEAVKILQANCNLVFPWTADLESVDYKPRQTDQQQTAA